jgi:AcrR family transcriptional regulator
LTPRSPDGRGPFTRPRKVHFSKLKPGPSQSAEEVRADQRARLRGATIELTAENGYSSLTVRGISRTAGVSTRTLYAHFENVEECFASTYRWIMRRAVEQLPDPAARGEEWEAGVRQWIRTLMATMAANPHAGKLVLVDAYDGGPAMLREIETATAKLEQKLAEGPLTTPLSQAIVAGVERVVRSRLLEDRAVELPRLSEELVDWILGVHDMESAPVQPSRSAAAEQRRLPPTQSRKDPAFAVFEVIGGDRGRILAAAARLSVANGYWNLTTTALRREAGVSRRQFDALYKDIASCYADAGRVLLTAAARSAIADSDGSLSWSSRVEQIVNGLCSAVAHSPILASLGFTDVFTPGSAGLFRRERLVKRSTAWVRASAPDSQRTTQISAEASLAASWRLIQAEAASSAGTSRLVESPQLVTNLVLTSSAKPLNKESRDERT